MPADIYNSGGKLIGMKELQAQMQELLKCVEADKAEPVLMAAGEKICEAGRPITPYDPERKKGHHLREAWVTKMMPRRRDRNPAPVIAAIDHRIAPHASLIEFGTVKFGARPYFRPTWDKMKRGTREEIIKELKNLIDKAI